MNIKDLGSNYKIVSAPDMGSPTNVSQLNNPTTAITPLAKSNDTLLDNPITRTIQNIFPGKQIGTSIGNSIDSFSKLARGDIKGFMAPNANDAPSTALKVGGDVAQIGLTALAPELGNGVTALGRIGANTALGAGLGATSAVANDKGVADIAKQGLEGAVLGGGASALGEGMKVLIDNLPKWLTKAALPKLDSKNIDYALQNTKVGSLKALQTNSHTALNSYENSIQSILSHPEFKGVAENSGTIVDNALSSFPNSDYTATDLLDNAKNIAPKVSKLITKFEAGQADIQEINTIRKELDAATKTVYTSLNRPPEAKLLGATLANGMRDYVQTNAPETQSIFSNYSKEIGLNKAINLAIKKGEQKIKLGDIAAGVGGFAHSGFKGALGAIVAERLIRNPSAQLGAAKLLQGGSRILAPAINTAFQGLKAPITNALLPK